MNLRNLTILAGLSLVMAGCTYPTSRTASSPGPYGSSTEGGQVVSSGSPTVYSGTAYPYTNAVSSSTQPTYNPGSYPSSQPAAPGTALPSAVTDADAALVSQVRQEFQRYGSLADLANSVTVSARYGTVTLAGRVPTEREKQMLDALVRNTPGVINIDNRLLVSTQPTGRELESSRIYSEAPQAGTATTLSTPGSGNMFSLHVQGLNETDRSVAQRIIQGLRTDTTLVTLVPKVDIEVAGGRVTLRGTVQNEQQRQTIAAAVQRATGSPVDNQLQIPASVNQP